VRARAWTVDLKVDGNTKTRRFAVADRGSPGRSTDRRTRSDGYTLARRRTIRMIRVTRVTRMTGSAYPASSVRAMRW
jgi:hypothetical protein